MAVMTRKMYKEARLPALPARFPIDAPKTSTHPPGHISRPPLQPKTRPESVARSQRTIAPPPVLASPVRFDAPSPLSSCASSPSERSSASSTYFTATSGLTQTGDSSPGVYVHPGVRWAQRKAEERWAFIRDGQTVRMCIPSFKEVPDPVSPPAPLRKISVDQEWTCLGTPVTHVAASVGSASRRSSINCVSSPSDGTITGGPSILPRESPFPEKLQKA